MLIKHMNNKELSQVCRSTSNIYQDKDGLFRELINNHKDRVKRCGCRKKFYKVHED